jgi:hypothetical protein
MSASILRASIPSCDVGAGFDAAGGATESPGVPLRCRERPLVSAFRAFQPEIGPRVGNANDEKRKLDKDGGRPRNASTSERNLDEIRTRAPISRPPTLRNYSLTGYQQYVTPLPAARAVQISTLPRLFRFQSTASWCLLVCGDAADGPTPQQPAKAHHYSGWQ